MEPDEFITDIGMTPEHVEQLLHALNRRFDVVCCFPSFSNKQKHFWTIFSRKMIFDEEKWHKNTFGQNFFVEKGF